jgi:acetylornithine deacetylase
MASEQEQRVLDAIGAGGQEVIDLLRGLLAFETITPDAEPVEHDAFVRHQAYVKQVLEGMGFGDIDVWEVDAASLEDAPGFGLAPDRDMRDMPVLVARLPGAGQGKSLILNGHYDVVPLGLRESWSHDPFAGEIEDGEGDVWVQIVPDEEATCMGTLAACQRGYTADAAIIPEPTNMRVGTAVRGAMGGHVTVRGRAGHAEQPQPHFREGGAVNAISKAMRVVQSMEEVTEQWRTQPDKQHPLVPPDSIIPTVIHGGEWSVTYPEKVVIRFDCMFVPGTADKRAEIEAKLAAVAANDPWLTEHPPELRIGEGPKEEWFYAAEVSEDEPIVQVAKDALADVGIEPALMGFGTLTDCIHLINYSHIPTVNLGPDIETAHMADEFVTLEQLDQLTRALALAIMRWCGVREAGR